MPTARINTSIVIVTKKYLSTGNCQIKLDCEPQLSAFMGVYDGHDGDFASEYCRQGLLPHIIAELRSTTQQSSKGWGFAVDRANAPLKLEEGVGKEDSTSKLDMEVPYTAAFQKAEERFGNELEPPTFDEVSKTQVTPLKVAPPGSYNPMQWISSATAAAEPRRGGTTACTMSLVSVAPIYYASLYPPCALLTFQKISLRLSWLWNVISF